RVDHVRAEVSIRGFRIKTRKADDGVERKAQLFDGRGVGHRNFTIRCTRLSRRAGGLYKVASSNRKDLAMRRMAGAAAMLLALAATPALADISTNPQSAPKGRYRIDPPHAVVMFCISHFGGTSNYCGWFPKISGNLHFNGAQPTDSKLSIAID